MPEEECFVRSVVENVARPQHRGVDVMREVGALRKRNYSDAEIAQKIGVTPSWVSLIVGLLERGEERLIAAVDSGLIPLTLAATIARSDDAAIGCLRGNRKRRSRAPTQDRRSEGMRLRKVVEGAGSARLRALKSTKLQSFQ
ncbi:plasmid partitioning protein RepB C-terminal domain-containing protein [uncultured Phenylobacterium sp.]|uniref:plasmid partitioning protein RepB C-terminal domain-containing protein n=1 Tax=uncultured Phenylobacterium sp. TaxID=349273 RepID=UPI0025D68524|nr:plasmid partitioning protein RepB C-terminal domain-containing protein [uncultured Phenylobacterium sp.]